MCTCVSFIDLLMLNGMWLFLDAIVKRSNWLCACDKAMTCWSYWLPTYIHIINMNASWTISFKLERWSRVLCCAAVPGAPPRKVEADALNSTALRVTWKPPLSVKQHGQIRGYQVVYSRLENGEPHGQPVIMDVSLPDAQVLTHSANSFQCRTRAVWTLPLVETTADWIIFLYVQ